ncbi:MAG: response regulator [Candidatus Cloacimonetes bacterium]|jgi:CheY-like chemotaxis protein|nr:response regulator [Candidatus Cloacimonadota bacterium]
MNREEKPILIVDDDMVDIMTVRRALKEINVTNPTVAKNNGEEALEYLMNESEEDPCIVLLDLNMPKMNGIEFLQKLNQTGKKKHVPIIVLTTSKDEQDKIQSFDLGASGYMLKPVDYDKFVEVMRTIHSYWTLSETLE